MIATMMHARSALSSCTAAAQFALAALAGLASSGCRGIDADVTYPGDLPSLDNQLQDRSPIPFHPGALKYFKEKGIGN